MTLQILFSVFALLYIGILFWLNRSRSTDARDEQFTIAGRNVGKYMTAASLSSGVRDASGIVVWLTFSILYGFNALVIATGMFLAWYLLSHSARAVHSIAKEKGYVTLSDYVRGEIGVYSSVVLSLLTIGTAFFLAAVQLNISGEIISRIYDIPLTLSILAVTVIVFAYLFLGGYGSVVKTDYIQWVLMILSLVVIGGLLLFSTGAQNISLGGVTNPDWVLLWGIAGIAFLSVYAAPDAWQRIFSARSGEDARQGFVGGIFFFLAITVLLVFTGILTGNVFGGLPEGSPLFSLFETGAAATLIAALFGVFIVTAMMSTLDTQAFLLAQTISKNFFPEIEQKKLIRWILFVLLILLALLAFTILDVIAFLFSAVGIISIAAPALAFYNLKLVKKSAHTDYLLTASMVAGAGVFVYLFAFGHLSQILMNLVPAAVALGVLALGRSVSFFK